MRVVIVTGQAPHHKNLCIRLAKSHEVVAIIHPTDAPPRGVFRSLRRVFRNVERVGLRLVLLHFLLRDSNRSMECATKASVPDVPDFRSAVEEYDRFAVPLVRFCDVRSAQTHALIRSLLPDVMVCLGGPIYPQEFITSCPLTLNYHSGLSPVYNGASTIAFAFAHGHIQMCGGTLMVINSMVDNGPILGHYLPTIHSGDTPRTLFLKTVAGAPLMYERLLKGLTENPNRMISISQPPPFFYTRRLEYGWHHKAMTECAIRRKLAARFSRPEKIIGYWRAPNLAAAQTSFWETINGLLWATRAET